MDLIKARNRWGFGAQEPDRSILEMDAAIKAAGRMIDAAAWLDEVYRATEAVTAGCAATERSPPSRRGWDFCGNRCFETDLRHRFAPWGEVPGCRQVEGERFLPQVMRRKGS